MKIFVSNALNDAEQAQLLGSRESDTFYLHGEFSEEDPPHPDFLQSRICFGNVPSNWIEAHPCLEWIQLVSVGFGEYLHIDRTRLSPSFRMTNLAGFFAEPVAESMLAGLLALLRGIHSMTVLKESSSWVGDPLREQLQTLQNARVLMYGYGSINRRFAELLEPFSCNLVIINGSSTLAELDEALPDADVVVCTVPDTPKTRNVFDCHRLKLLKKNSIILNFGRGTVLDEDALGTRLSQHQIGGAVIDVTRQEPLPANHKFWKCPNTIITQHSAGGTADEISAKIAWFSKNLQLFCKGQNLVSEVNYEQGY